eukprot:358532-Chlamydomonas_euryale.AAC.3
MTANGCPHEYGSPTLRLIPAAGRRANHIWAGGLGGCEYLLVHNISSLNLTTLSAWRLHIHAAYTVPKISHSRRRRDSHVHILATAKATSKMLIVLSFLQEMNGLTSECSMCMDMYGPHQQLSKQSDSRRCAVVELDKLL